MTKKRVLKIQSLFSPFLVFVLLGWLAPSISSAQNAEFFSNTVELVENFTGSTSSFAIDLDGDGDMDIVASAKLDGEVSWWENVGVNGDGTSWAKHVVKQGFDEAYDIHCADFDDDNDTDIIAVAYNNQNIYWYQNNLPSQTWNEHFIGETDSGASAVYSADFDDDNGTDVITSDHVTNNILLRLNNGDGTIWGVPILVGETNDEVTELHTADINGDGSEDIVSSSFSGDINWWENNGDGTYWEEYLVTNEFYSVLSVYAADLDSDNDTDIVAAADDDNNTDNLMWWEQQVDQFDEIIWIPHSISEASKGASLVYAEDMDNDGDLDVLSVIDEYDDNDTDKIIWWENRLDNNDTNWNPHIIDEAYYNTSSLSAADVNGDGTMDALGTSLYSDDNSTDSVTWWGPSELYNVTFKINQAGGGTISGDSNQMVQHGGNCTTVTTHAATTQGYEFDHWKMNGITYPGGSSLTVTNVTMNMIFVAYFRLKNYNVTFEVDQIEGGTIGGNLSQTVQHESDCTTVTAHAATTQGYEFDHWKMKRVTYPGGSSLTVKNVTMDMEFVAYFRLKNYNVTFEVDQEGGGTLGGDVSQMVQHGSDCTTVTAHAATTQGYEFDHWKMNGTTYPGGSSLTVTNVTKNMEFVAYFKLKDYNVTFEVDQEGGGTLGGDLSQTVQHESDCTTVTAHAATTQGYEFDHWKMK
ncbi:MAG: VCBS repeat-containing protein, partial [Desulfobacterales bacterium]|nr:VCBS repeat-containing protein [Desulfobacterales bacterium]